MVAFIETESGAMVTTGWERENGGLLFNGDRVSVGDDEKVLKMNNGDSWKQCEYI